VTNLRIVTLNLWGTEPPLDARLALAARQLVQLAPDAVCLQEVRPLDPQRPGRTTAEVLADALGMTAHYQTAVAWQGVAGLADPKRRRGGVTLGIATALSLAIGLEMIIYLVVGAVAVALFWIADREERDRVSGYALSLGGGTALAYLVVASYANRGAVCDALSEVWLTEALVGCAVLLGPVWISPRDWKARLALAAGSGHPSAHRTAGMRSISSRRRGRAPSEATGPAERASRTERPLQHKYSAIWGFVLQRPFRPCHGWLRQPPVAAVVRVLRVLRVLRGELFVM